MFNPNKYVAVTVIDADGELEGFAVVVKDTLIGRLGTAKPDSVDFLTPVMCCSTCAWAKLEQLENAR